MLLMDVVTVSEIRILIADADLHFTEMARLFLKSIPDMRVIGTLSDGQEALEAVRIEKPDAVVFELALPGLDGFNLLRCINELPVPPATICCTRFYSEVALEAAREAGVSYFLFKPIDLQSLRHTILACVQAKRKIRRAAARANTASAQSAEMQIAQIRNYIISLGVPAKMIGCSYLTEAVRLAQTDPDLMRNLSKGLYLEISRDMDSTPVRIERCMRNAISAAHQSGSLGNRMATCPSNKEFINFVVRSMAQ